MNELAKKTASAVKEWVSKSIDSVRKDFDELKSNVVTKDHIEEIVKSIPVPKDGTDGVCGKDGENGKDGRDGRDAIELEIVSQIDENKTYGRGTYAIHKGGFWRAFQQTKGMHGWENIVDGVADIKIDYDGMRGITVSTQKSSGEIVEKTFSMPIVIDKGVFKDGQEYELNDGVTFGGSYWIAQKSSPEGKPGSSPDFRLAVKAGRNANTQVKI